MPTFMDATNTIRRSDDAPPPQGIDYGNLRKQVILALIEKMATQDPEERAAKLRLMDSEAEHNNALAYMQRNNPKADPVAQAQKQRAELRADPEEARTELFGKDLATQRDNQIDSFVSSLGDNFDASKVEPQIQRMQNELTGPLAAAGEDVLGPVKAAIKEKVWQEIERRKLQPRKAGPKGADTLPGAGLFDATTGTLGALIPSKMPSWYPIGSAL